MLDLVMAAAAGGAAIAFFGAWSVAGVIAFRNGEDEQLGRADLRVVSVAIAVAAGLSATRSPYLPDALLLGVLCGALSAIALTDLRLGVIYNALTLPLALVAVGDALIRGRLLDAGIGLLATGLLIAVAYRSRIVGEGDVKAAVAIGVVLGGFFGVVAVAVGLIGVLALHLVRQRRSRLPVSTAVPWAPLLALGVGVVLAVAATPAGALFVVSVP